MRGQKDTKPCANCGASLTRLVSQARGKHWYCNPRCQAAHSPSPITVSRDSNPYRGQKDTRPCANCGLPVTRFLSQRRAEAVWNCSMRCKGITEGRRRLAAGTWKRPEKPRRGDTIPCDVCGTEFYRLPGEIAKDRRFCSPQCVYTAQTKTPVLKECLACGKEMRLKPSQSVRVYCTRRCQSDARTKRPLDWPHNGRLARKDSAGYVMVWEPNHPRSPSRQNDGWHPLHRIVMEKALGRYLTTEEQIDHINAVKDDNRIENLQVLSQQAHSVKTTRDNWKRLQEYRRRFGPLE